MGYEQMVHLPTSQAVLPNISHTRSWRDVFGRQAETQTGETLWIDEGVISKSWKPFLSILFQDYKFYFSSTHISKVLSKKNDLKIILNNMC